MPLSACYGSCSLGGLVQIIFPLAHHHSVALKEAERLMLWPKWTPLSESNSCTSDPIHCLGKSRRKGLCYKLWAFQGPSISGLGWKAVTSSLAWSRGDYLTPPFFKKREVWNGIWWRNCKFITEIVSWYKIRIYNNALTNVSYMKFLHCIFNLI